MDFTQLIIQLVAGAAGGNVVGKAVSKLDQGTLINSIAGIVGGGLGGQILGALTGGAVPEAGGADLGGIISSVVGGGAGGAGQGILRQDVMRLCPDLDAVFGRVPLLGDVPCAAPLPE